MSELRATEGDIRHALKNEIRNRTDPTDEVVVAVVATAYDEGEPAVADVLDQLKKEGEVYDAGDGLRVTDDHLDEPESKADATASGLGLAALRTRIERYGDEDGAPRAEVENAVGKRAVAEALCKGAIYEVSGYLHLTDGDALADGENYAEAREAAGDDPDLAPGTLQTVRGIVEKNGSPACSPERVNEVAVWSPETIAEALGVLERRGEVYEREDGYVLTDRHE